MTRCSERARAAAGFRWAPGMVTLEGWRVHRLGDGLGAQREDGQGRTADWLDWERRQPQVPDLDDPATLGALHAVAEQYLMLAVPYDEDEIVEALERTGESP